MSYTVIFDYDAEEEGELTLRVGDLLENVTQDESGWWTGDLGHRRGLFPYNYVAESNTEVASPIETDTIVHTTLPTPPGKTIKDIKRSFKSRASSTMFGAWAMNLTRAGGVSGALLGLSAWIWGANEDTDSAGVLTICIGVYSFVLGIGILLYYYKFIEGAKQSSTGRLPYQAFVTLVLSIPLWIVIPTMIAGFCLLAASIVCYVSWRHKETWERPAVVPWRSNSRGFKYTSALGPWDNLLGLYHKKREDGELGELIFLACYFLLNVVLFFQTLAYWNSANNDLKLTGDEISGYGPFAKAFGKLLDLNCAVLLFPVCRTFLRGLYNLSTKDQRTSSVMLRKVLYFIPIDSALEFHILVAKIILVCAIGHTWMHFLNLALEPDNTLAIFGVHPFWNGAIVVACMVFMYTAADPFIKRFHFEAFWYTHHLFIVFYIVLILHGRNFYNPNFVSFSAFPMVLYILERIYRHYTSQRPCTILSACHMRPSLLMLEFEQSGVFENGYKEGQYVFINCPYVAESEWHPFTISSAPENPTVTLHIRVQGEGSWTRGVQDFLQVFGKIDGAYQVFSHMTDKGLQKPGMTLGPDNRPIFKVYGPHSAPTQHVTEYANVMIIGAGIGVTPVASTLKSIVMHKWWNSVGECFPAQARFYWVVSYKEISSFRWFLREIKEAFDANFHMKAKNPESMYDKLLEFHIFVTSYKPTDSDESWETPAPLTDVSFWGPSHAEETQLLVQREATSWTEVDLLEALHRPEANGRCLGDNEVYIYSGRPKWEDHFQVVADAYPLGSKIGVTFCGNPRIGEDLGHQCSVFSSATDERFFKFHKEKF